MFTQIAFGSIVAIPEYIAALIEAKNSKSSLLGSISLKTSAE
jgi:hypothetical protein